MPNQQPRTSEHSRCGASSKTAKEKSNSSTLMAIRDSKDADSSSGRGSRCSSEKDSGYSDGSDWPHTDAEDQRSSKRQSRGSEHAKTSQPGQSQQLGPRNPGNAPRMPAGRDHPPIYIIKDMVLKQQPAIIQKGGQLHWTNDGNFSGSPHVILLQQPALVPATLQQLHKPPSRRSNVTGKKVNSSYLPILNSYPRIAPHPSKKPPDKASSHESQNLSKRVCTDPKTDDAPVFRGLPEQRHHKQPKPASACSLPSPSATREGLSSSNQGPPSVSSLHTASPSSSSYSSSSSSSSSSSHLPTSRGHHRDSTPSARHRRFLNTVEILQQSGLLDITLRTKELLRQSSATDRGIAQLRQHTELLCQAANNPGSSPNAGAGAATWEHLHHIMADSGNYPDLKALQSFQLPPPPPPPPDSASQPERVSPGDAHAPPAAQTSEVSPSPVAENDGARSQAGRKRQAGSRRSDAVAFVPPDSSTG